MDMIASNRDLAETYHRGLVDFQSLDGTEALRFSVAIARLIRTVHELHFQWRVRAMDASIWHSWVNAVADVSQYPGFQEIWKIRRHQYTQDFQNFMDNHADAKDAKQIYPAFKS